MRSRPTLRPQRKPIFVGCEGQSESSYVALIQDFAMVQALPIHLHNVVLAPGAGDPLARVQRAIVEIKKLTTNREKPKLSFVLLDEDQAIRDPDRAMMAGQSAERNGIELIWQRPCFEALLLRHFPNHENRRPHDSAAAKQTLERLWPDYRKGMPRSSLAMKIEWEWIVRASRVEPDLNRFLGQLGFKL